MFEDGWVVSYKLLVRVAQFDSIDHLFVVVLHREGFPVQADWFNLERSYFVFQRVKVIELSRVNLTKPTFIKHGAQCIHSLLLLLHRYIGILSLFERAKLFLALFCTHFMLLLVLTFESFWIWPRAQSFNIVLRSMRVFGLLNWTRVISNLQVDLDLLVWLAIELTSRSQSPQGVFRQRACFNLIFLFFIQARRIFFYQRRLVFWYWC